MIVKKADLIDFKREHLDKIGNIYEYEGKIIRIINKSAQNSVLRLMRSLLIKELLEKQYLVETYETDNVDEEGRIILEHRKIEPKQSADLWTFDMMRDAAILALDINLVCMNHGYQLKDCHYDNIMFDGCRPVWVDFGSIVHCREKGKWDAKNQFMQYFYYPLLLWSRGFSSTAEALIKSRKLNLEELERLCSSGLSKVNKRFADVDWPNKDDYNEIMKMKKKIKKMDLADNDSNWGSYHDKLWGKSNWRFDYEIEWIKNQSDITSMVEIAANQGVFSFLVAERTDIKKIIAVDYDKIAVNKMYNRLKETEFADCCIVPLSFNFVSASKEQLTSLKSDLVVANALTHHLLLTQGMRMDLIVEHFACLTDKYLIVEFMPKGVSQNRTSQPEWYNLENFVGCLERKFDILNINKQSNARVIIIAQKSRKD